MDDSVSNSSSPASDFPIFAGGPLYRVQQRIRVVREGRRRFGLATLYAVLVAWVPMVLLAAAEGLAFGPTRLESFLMDFEVNVRFLVTVPVFLFAESICEEKLRAVVRQFRDANLVLNEARDRFEQLLLDTIRLSHSNRAEMALVGLAYVHSMIAFVYVLYYPEATWRLPVRDGRHILSMAGGWYFLVAFPLFSVLLLRWLWRIILWWRLLRQISKIELNLSPAHRDEAGGLGFLSGSLAAFAGFAFGNTALCAGGVADFVIYEGESPLQYEWEVAGLIVFLLVLIAGPLMFFVLRLYEVKESASFQYGALASRHIQQVDRTWLSGTPVKEDVGIDFRAVAHIGSSVKAVHEMSIIPLYKDDVLKLLFIALLPFLPLLTSLIPMNEVLELLLKVVV